MAWLIALYIIVGIPVGVGCAAFMQEDDPIWTGMVFLMCAAIWPVVVGLGAAAAVLYGVGYLIENASTAVSSGEWRNWTLKRKDSNGD